MQKRNKVKTIVTDRFYQHLRWCVGEDVRIYQKSLIF